MLRPEVPSTTVSYFTAGKGEEGQVKASKPLATFVANLVTGMSSKAWSR